MDHSFALIAELREARLIIRQLRNVCRWAAERLDTAESSTPGCACALCEVIHVLRDVGDGRGLFAEEQHH